MYTHNLDPILFELGFLSVRWYSLAYILGILAGWWLGKKLIQKKLNYNSLKFNVSEFDDLVTYLIISIILGGRMGYVIFYNFDYYFLNPIDIFKVWEGGMSFHGALVGIIFGTYLFASKRNLSTFFFLDVIACVAPIGIFFGRVANFINGELIGKKTDVYWGVIFPKIDNLTRHPSQLYEAFLEGVILFLILNIVIKINHKTGTCSILFLILYGIFRIIAELFREPDIQVGYFYNFLSMGTVLSILMIFSGIIIFLKKDDIK